MSKIIYTGILVILIFKLTGCEKENNKDSDCRSIQGEWITYNEDIIDILGDCTGVIRYYSDTNLILDCKISKESISINYNNQYREYQYGFDLYHGILIIYNINNRDSTYFVNRPNWLDDLIIKRKDSDYYYGCKIFIIGTDGYFLYYFNIPYASCLMCETYDINGNRINWEEEPYNKFQFKEEILIWVNPNKIFK